MFAGEFIASACNKKRARLLAYPLNQAVRCNAHAPLRLTAFLPPSGTLAAVERFIPQALAAGYRFVTLGGAVEAKADGDLGEDDTR